MLISSLDLVLGFQALKKRIPEVLVTMFMVLKMQLFISGKLQSN